MQQNRRLPRRSSPPVRPSPREVFLAAFVQAAALVLDMPLLVKAFCRTFAPEDASRTAIQRTVRRAWAALEDLELAGVVRRKIGDGSRFELSDLHLCPTSLSRGVFVEVELMLSLEDAGREVAHLKPPAVTEEPRAPVALCA